MNSALVALLFLTLVVGHQALNLDKAFPFLHDDGCEDNLPTTVCNAYVRKDLCHTEKARTKCGKTCKSCGKLCTDASIGCQDSAVREELCGEHDAAFLICPRSCGLCVW